MLRQLSIRHYAIIDELQLEFAPGVNIITGETGAGKSILLGALSLLLGGRADSRTIYPGQDKCIIEAEFDTAPLTQAWFEGYSLDYAETTIIRRELTTNGKSRAFVNDTPVTLPVLRTLGERLVNMHSQHETLDLISAGMQLDMLDTIAQHQEAITTYHTLYQSYSRDKKTIENLVAESQKAAAERDFIIYQYEELQQANLIDGEQTALEQEQQSLAHVEEIQRATRASIMLLSDGEQNTLDLMSEVQQHLKQLRTHHEGIRTLSDRLAQAAIEIKDIAATFDDIAESTTQDPERLAEIAQRLSTLYRLQKKHQINDLSALIALRDSLATRLDKIASGDTEIVTLQNALTEKHKQLLAAATRLHNGRVAASKPFEKGVLELLQQAGMPGASFHVSVQELPVDTLHADGRSEVQFLFSANKGFAPQPIREVASGGELSRLMLAIKSLTAMQGASPTLVFDEIDTGISGETALRVSEIMRRLSSQCQLICITHLPQIARIAHKHFHLYKDTSAHKTATKIEVLTEESRVREIAKMLGGDRVSEAAIANARDLIAG